MNSCPYARIVMRPDAEEWPEALRANRAGERFPPWLCAAGGGEAARRRSLSQAARQALLEAAIDYTGGLHALAAARGVAIEPSAALASLASSSATRAGDVATPLILTGHQAVVFHPGLEWKYFATARFARAQRAISLAVVMDLDPGDAGAFLVPQPESTTPTTDDLPSLVTVEHSLSEAASGLLAAARVAPRERIDELTQAVVGRLRSLQLSAAAERTTRVMQVYGQLAGLSLVESHAIAQLAERRLHVELLLPFSRMMRLAPYRAAIGWLLEDASRLHATYNRLLDGYRVEHGLRNHANPFPNLGQREDLRELPFWRVDHASATRDAVWFRDTPDGPQFVAGGETLPRCGTGEGPAWLATQLPASQQIVPRGALVSLLFRSVACDLFVHGTGGGTYDPFTDRLMAEYCGVEPARFSVASGTRHLFEGWPERLASLDELAAQSRDVVHHPERHFGRGWFAAEAEQRLRELTDRKQQVVAQLRTARQDGRPGAAMGRELETVAAEIRAVVDAQLASKLDMRLRISEATRAALLERRWPWFYFPAIDADNASGAGTSG